MPLPSGPRPRDDPYLRWCGLSGPGDERPVEPAPVVRSAPALETLVAAEQAAERVAAQVEAMVQECPVPPLHALEVIVVDDDDRPLVAQRVQVGRSDDEVMSSSTDATGLARFDGLEPGRYRLSLPLVDQDGWTVLSSEPLPHEREASADKPRWGAPEAASTQTVEHTVADGECLSTLAFRHGWVGDSLWAQNTALAERRASKNVLAPGDVVLIPPVRVKDESVSSSQRVRIRRVAALEELRIRFTGDGYEPEHDDEPRKAVPYLLTIVSDDGEEQRSGKTDGDGFIIALVPSSTREARVELGAGDQIEHHVFRAARLDPLDTPAGIRSRLLNLDFEVDEHADGLGPITARALAQFQREQELSATGEPDAPTRDALATLHLT